MTTMLTNEDSFSGSEVNPFVPMTENQMATTKGGDDWPDWLQNLIDQFEELLELLDEYLDTEVENADEADWEDLEQELAEDGYTDPTWQEILQDW